MMRTFRRGMRFRLATFLLIVAGGAALLGFFKLLVRPATAVVRERVVFADGSPAACVQVTAQATKPSQPGEYPRERSVITDRNGEYSLRAMEAAAYNIWASHSGFTASAVDSLSCQGDVRAPEIVLVRGAVLRGRVLDADTGEPAAYRGPMGVALRGPSRPESGPAVEFAPLQDDGAFTIRAAPGENYLYLPWTDPSAPTSTRLLVHDGQTLDIELLAPPEFSQAAAPQN